MSAAWASIFRSTSHSDTTSTGATWINRSTSALPYQPQPIRPTRGVLSAGAANTPEAARERPAAAPAGRKSRRSMGGVSGREDDQRIEDSVSRGGGGGITQSSD